MNQKNIFIWIISDGKRGHENQSEALLKGLSNSFEISKKKLFTEMGLFGFCFRVLRKKHLRLEPVPEIVVGTGRGTHWPLIFCKLILGCHTICLMNPSVPKSWFDLCVVPRHDGIREGGNVILTEGPLTLAEYTGRKNQTSGLILIGGDSSHYIWDQESLLSQIQEVVASANKVKWIISDSRRTPKNFRNALREINHPNIKYSDFENLKPNWLIEQLNTSQYVWITPDSVSMIYESLSSGAQVGVFDLRERKQSRVTRNRNYLIDEGWIRTRHSKSWQTPPFLNERDRVAKLIEAKWANLGQKENLNL